MDIPPHSDPAEQSGYLRYFYRDWRPTGLARVWNRAYAWVASLGILPRSLVTLQVRDPASRQLHSTILAKAELDGRSFLVSMLGNGSDWVRNVRAAGGQAWIKRGRVREVKLCEIPVAARAPFLKAWAQVATSGRQHLPVTADAPVQAFAAIAAHYPVFLIEDVPAAQP